MKILNFVMALAQVYRFERSPRLTLHGEERESAGPRARDIRTETPSRPAASMMRDGRAWVGLGWYRSRNQREKQQQARAVQFSEREKPASFA